MIGGGDEAGTTYFNGDANSTSGLFGGVNISCMQITEYAA